MPAGSPGAGFWLFPPRDTGRFLPLRHRSGVSVLIGDLESSELWIASVTGVDTG